MILPDNYFGKEPESKMVQVGETESDEWYAGGPTALGSGLGTAAGAFGILGGPVVGAATMGLGGALGGWLGSIFEPDPEPVYVEQFEPMPPPPPPRMPAQQLGGSAIGGYYSQNYGVQDPYGFGLG